MQDALLAVPAHVENALKAAWADGIAKSSPLAVLLVAFDGSDQATGAEAVQTLERALRAHCGRQHDSVFRHKRDEFLALLPDTSPAGARQVGGQIVEAMRHAENSATVSVGVAVSVPDEQQSAADLVRRAENVMQSAQDRGGDQCLGGADSAASTPLQSTIAQLRDLLPGKKKASKLKRRTD